MELLSDLVAGVQSDMNVNGDSTLFDPGTITLAINRAYRKCAGFFKWPFTRDALKTSTILGQEYYDYPTIWRPDSIWKIRVDGQDYGDPLTLKDYYYEIEHNHPSGRPFAFSNQNMRFFLDPIPDENGDNNIELWGFRFPDQLINQNDTTIFSYSMPECNEAVVLEAASILRIKGGEQPVRLLRYVQGALLMSMEAQQILTTAWEKIIQEEAKMDRTTPMFDVPDLFPTGVNRANLLRNKIGNF